MVAPNMNGRLYLADAHQSSPASLKYAYVLPTGETKYFPPFFIPFQAFFSPNLLFGYIFAEKYTPLDQSEKKEPVQPKKMRFQ